MVIFLNQAGIIPSCHLQVELEGLVLKKVVMDPKGLEGMEQKGEELGGLEQKGVKQKEMKQKELKWQQEELVQKQLGLEQKELKRKKEWLEKKGERIEQQKKEVRPRQEKLRQEVMTVEEKSDEMQRGMEEFLQLLENNLEGEGSEEEQSHKSHPVDGEELLHEAEGLLDEGEQSLDEGEALIGEEKQLLNVGKGQLDEGEELVDKGELLPDETEMLLEEVEAGEKDEAAYIFFCYPCDKIFNSAVSMEDHKRWKHGVESNCTLCGKMFDSRMQLARHEKSMHCGQPRHTCKFCSKGFMHECHMKRHMELCSKGKNRKKKSAKESDYKCTVCNLGFANSKSLAQHFTRFHRIAKSTNNFVRHFVRRRVVLKCSCCSQTFKRAQGLKNHMARHMAKTGHEEQAENYPCGTCNQNFASKSVLGTHIKRVHQTLVRAFTCPLCCVKLPKKKVVAQHMSPVHM